MIVEVKIPSPGESISEAEIGKWFVEDGSFVKQDQELAEIESDKATLPLIAPESGVIKILIPSGVACKIGETACTIDASKSGEVSIKINKEPVSKSMDYSATKISSLENSKPEKQSEKFKIESSGNNHIKITPLAQKIMEDNNLNLDDVMAGLKKISKKDIESVIRIKESPISEVQGTSITGNREITRTRITQLRKKLSARLVAVKNETAMLTTFNEVDMSRVITLRKKFQDKFTLKYGIKLGFMSFFTFAVTEALKSSPKINSLIDGDEIITPSYIDIGIAVQTDKGLIVPIIRNTENATLPELEIKIADLAEKSRSGKISIAELTGGTFTITNGGVFGSLLSTPILNPPQSAILGTHKIMDRPVAINGKVEIRPMMYLALSYDHRIVDGKDSVGFLLKIKELLESPEELLFNGKNMDSILIGD